METWTDPLTGQSSAANYSAPQSSDACWCGPNGKPDAFDLLWTGSNLALIADRDLRTLIESCWHDRPPRPDLKADMEIAVPSPMTSRSPPSPWRRCCWAPAPNLRPRRSPRSNSPFGRAGWTAGTPARGSTGFASDERTHPPQPGLCRCLCHAPRHVPGRPRRCRVRIRALESRLGVAKKAHSRGRTRLFGTG